MAGVDVAVANHELVQPGCLYLMIRLAKAAGEGQRSEVGWFICASSLVAEPDEASSPSFWGEAGGVDMSVLL